MSVTYINVPAWIQVKQPVFHRDNWGIDTAEVLWRGPAPLKEAFELDLANNRWKAMPDFPNMRLSDWQTELITPSFPGVLLRYIGIRDLKIPPVKGVNTTSLQTATGSGVDTATKKQVSGTFTYQASRTTYTWFEKATPPQLSPYAVVDQKIDPFQNIISYQIQDDNTGKPINSVPLSSFVAVFNSLIKRELVSTYEREPLIPNALWACHAEVDYKIVN